MSRSATPWPSLEATEASRRMVEAQVAARGVRDPRVLEAMVRLDRRLFVPEAQADAAYEDRALPLANGQTISQPYIVGYMTEALELEPSHRVLEVGTGSGYQTALLAMLARSVITIEQDPELAIAANARLLDLLPGARIEFVLGDGARGWSGGAPYDRVIVTAAARAVPPMLFRQLAIGGILIGPVDGPDGAEDGQRLCRWRKAGEGRFDAEDLMAVRFVPLLEGGAEPRPLSGPGPSAP